MATKLSGGCLCGDVRWECSADPVLTANCYCTHCQKSSGTALASVFFVPKAAFKLVKGDVKYYEVTADSGNKVKRGFCPNCGSPVTTMPARMPDIIGIKVGSMDEPSKFNPQFNIFMASAPTWAPVSQNVAAFPKMPPMEGPQH
jgi:hypothetical protein